MARIRTVKPEFWTSEQITECSIPARLLFIGLLNFADDGGRMPLNLKRIKGQIFPHDDISSTDVRRMLDELSSSEFGRPLLDTYEVDGKQYLQITGWAKHQKIDRPTYQFPDKTGTTPTSKGFQPDNKHSSSARRGLDVSSTPERSLKERKGVERKGKESKGREESPSLARRSRAREDANGIVYDDWPDDYRERFLAAFQNHTDLKRALAALDRLAANPNVSFEFMIAQIEQYFETKPADRQALNGKTYIEQERWNDKPAAAAGNGHHRPTRGDRARELARQVEARERAAEAGGAAEAVGGAELGGDDARLVSGGEP